MKALKRITADETLILLPGQLVSVIADTGLTVQLSCGRVWVTIEGQSDDYWLDAGDTLAVAAGKHVLIEADKVFSRVEVLAQKAGQARVGRAWVPLRGGVGLAV